jgi:hypothetical protein
MGVFAAGTLRAAVLGEVEIDGRVRLHDNLRLEHQRHFAAAQPGAAERRGDIAHAQHLLRNAHASCRAGKFHRWHRHIDRGTFCRIDTSYTDMSARTFMSSPAAPTCTSAQCRP